MKISDKELDELFNSKLNGLEAEPSANLWDNIAGKLDEKPKKKSIVPVLRIAAGVLVALSVGLLLFWQQVQPVKKPIPQKVVKVKVRPVQPLVVQENTIESKDRVILTAKNKVIKEASTHKRVLKEAVLKLIVRQKPEMVQPSTETFAQNQLQQQEGNSIQTYAAAVPDASVTLKVQPATKIDAEVVKQAPILAAKANKPAPVAFKRKGIRNVGDLVNLVMAKVDKREDKLIEFSDNDDGDESNITGINLGIISIKKEK